MFKEFGIRHVVLVILTLGLSATAQSGAHKGKRLVFGVVPQQAASKLAVTWTPMLDYLSAKTGYKIQFETAPDIPTFEQRLADGDFDIAYVNPNTYIVVQRSEARYRAFAKERARKLTGIIVVRKDSPIKRLEDLKDKELAFPAESAFAASVIPRAHLNGRKISFTPKYVGSHDSVYLSVAKGILPAGGGVNRTLERVSPEVRDQLRILWTTPPYTPHPFAAHKRVSSKTIEQLAAAMRAMENDPVGKGLLEELAFAGITTADDKEYNDVRALNLTSSHHLIKAK